MQQTLNPISRTHPKPPIHFLHATPDPECDPNLLISIPVLKTCSGGPTPNHPHPQIPNLQAREPVACNP